MEPVFMILGQYTATAAVLAIDNKVSTLKFPFQKLQEVLIKDGQILER